MGALSHCATLPRVLGVVEDGLRKVLGVDEGQLVGPYLLALLGAFHGVAAVVGAQLEPHRQELRQLLLREPLGLERDGQKVARLAAGRHLGVVLDLLLVRRPCGSAADLLGAQRRVSRAHGADGGDVDPQAAALGGAPAVLALDKAMLALGEVLGCGLPPIFGKARAHVDTIAQIHCR